MSGDIVGVLGYKRAQGTASVSVPAEVRELVQALAQDSALPALWSNAAREAISQRITDPEQKLAAQRAVQDVQDGCLPCRGELRAWLRGTLTEAPVLLQSRSVSDTAFRRAWNGKEPAQ
jgi:predicted DNA-binding protein